MTTKQKIQQLEQQVATLWHIINDERLWDQTVIHEIKKRSRAAQKDYANKKLRSAGEIFA